MMSFNYVVGKRPLPWPGFPKGLPRGTVITGEDARALEGKPHLQHLAVRVPEGAHPLPAEAEIEAAKPLAPKPPIVPFEAPEAPVLEGSSK